MKNYYLISALLIIQSFFAGVFFNDSFSNRNNWRRYLITVSILFTGFGWVIFYIGVALAALIYRLYDYFSLGFIIKYIIFKTPFEHFDKDLHAEMLKKMQARKPLKWYNVSKRIEYYCIHWITKNYPK